MPDWLGVSIFNPFSDNRCHASAVFLKLKLTPCKSMLFSSCRPAGWFVVNLGQKGQFVRIQNVLILVSCVNAELLFGSVSIFGYYWRMVNKI